jgi:hypothetical protein
MRRHGLTVDNVRAVELVTADGRVAGRLRVLARQCATWVPAVVALAACAIVLGGAIDTQTVTPVGWAVLAVVPPLWGVWVWHAARTPARSVADRLAGTYLVPG